MKINHDLRHKISVVEAQGKALIEQKVELEAGAQTRGQEVGALRQEVTRLRERLKGDAPTQDPEQPPPQPPSPAQVRHRKHVKKSTVLHRRVFSLPTVESEMRNLHFLITRSEERRVGKECLRLCRSRWSPYH